ncbi:MAG: DUF4336 domain-containing protein [Myxococcales bacterium]|nr:DUF4336 domain-containing protein [Myxococcales bacterium]
MLGSVPDPSPVLEPFVADELWTARVPLRFFGIQMGTRMTVVRLRDGGLWIHSPVRPTPELCDALDRLGEPRVVVAPNFLHHLYVGDFVARYPVPVYGSRRLPRKRPDLEFAGVLGDEPEAAWAGQIDQAALGGDGMFDEVAFLHRATGTLVLTDLCQHADESWPPGSRLLARMAGIFGQHRPPRDVKWLLGRHKAEVKRMVDTILSWDFDRMIVAHGALVPSGARAAFERAYAFVQGW